MTCISSSPPFEKRHPRPHGASSDCCDNPTISFPQSKLFHSGIGLAAVKPEDPKKAV